MSKNRIIFFDIALIIIALMAYFLSFFLNISIHSYYHFLGMRSNLDTIIGMRIFSLFTIVFACLFTVLVIVKNKKNTNFDISKKQVVSLLLTIVVISGILTFITVKTNSKTIYDEKGSISDENISYIPFNRDMISDSINNHEDHFSMKVFKDRYEHYRFFYALPGVEDTATCIIEICQSETKSIISQYFNQNTLTIDTPKKVYDNEFSVYMYDDDISNTYRIENENTAFVLLIGADTIENGQISEDEVLKEVIRIYNSFVNKSSNSVNVSLKYSGFSTESDFSGFNSAEKVYHNKKNGYNIIKIDCLIKNNLNKAIKVTGAEPLNDNDFIIPNECIDIEPTFPINANTQLNVTMYAYAKENLTEEEIKERIKKVNINLVFYTEKGEKIVPDSYWSS